jgi:hypothetical protein
MKLSYRCCLISSEYREYSEHRSDAHYHKSQFCTYYWHIHVVISNSLYQRARCQVPEHVQFNAQDASQ